VTVDYLAEVYNGGTSSCATYASAGDARWYRRRLPGSAPFPDSITRTIRALNRARWRSRSRSARLAA